ncbi:hypothetical protein CBL_06472 [Carabus blaptoides fortunei]
MWLGGFVDGASRLVSSLGGADVGGASIIPNVGWVLVGYCYNSILQLPFRLATQLFIVATRLRREQRHTDNKCLYSSSDIRPCTKPCRKSYASRTPLAFLLLYINNPQRQSHIVVWLSVYVLSASSTSLIFV